MSGDAKFFARGKVEEFRVELLNKKDKSHTRKKETLKKIVANMTIGHEDMSPLFPAIIECMALPVIEIKKMCYLFVMNYARQKPEGSQHALRHLLRDLESPNPLLRALALRTISTVHVKEYVDNLVQPLRQLLQDSDPYVRKTAALGVAKLHGHDRKLIETTSLVEGVRDLLRDSNPTVMSPISYTSFQRITLIISGSCKCTCFAHGYRRQVRKHEN
jgi:AP-2 complex subunit beta-1